LQQKFRYDCHGKIVNNIGTTPQVEQHIARKLPEGVSLLMQPIIENMYVFYQVTDVHAYAIWVDKRLFIEIPLKRNDRYFEVFRPHSLPHYDNEIEEFISIRTFKDILLAVSKDRQRFTTMTQEELSQCQEEIFTICPADFVLIDATAQHGLIALDLGKDEVVRRACKRTIENETSDAVWSRVPNNSLWIYSVSLSTRINKPCQTPSPVLERKSSLSIDLEGTKPLNKKLNI
jgi:hypothetical protein